MKALLGANEFLKVEIAELRKAVSKGYSRGWRRSQRDRKEAR